MAAQFATERSDNPLWRYALDLYSRPGIKECVLQLQNEFATDVVMLLADRWLLQQNRRWPAETQLADYLQWRAEIVVPLRDVRQQLTRESEPLRSRLLTAELSAEQEAIRRLYLALSDEAAEAGTASVTDLSALFFRMADGETEAQKKEAIRPLFQQFAALSSD